MQFALFTRKLLPAAALLLAMVLLTASPFAQTAHAQGPGQQPPGAQAPGGGAAQQADPRSLAPIAAPARRPVTQVTSGSGELPNTAGQVWREYDIRPYTANVANLERPEQAVIDWVLRETGTEIWFNAPLGILSGDRNKITVYHTPEIQRVVADCIDRFVASQAESYVFGARLVTLSSPNWRTKVHRMLRPVTVDSPGIEAWLVAKEDAAVLLGEIRKRTDFREHNSPNLVIHNGQTHHVARTRPRNYVKGVHLIQSAWPGYELETGQVEEGYTMQFSPLMSLDGRTVDAVLKCEVHQVEKLVPVSIDVPTPGDPNQRAQVQVPQMAHWLLHERFRWPADHVLLISAGVGAMPSPEAGGPLNIPNILNGAAPGRADALLFLEAKGRADQTLVDPRERNAGAMNYRGRY